ncbi:bifunctional glutamate N-acetyltransferase/amino-acid acetyltransferase ArgJ [Gilvimarinus sp. F26214L]|uniref:bifunctional glutamate N-acetyltransferase/amino-acid acetyltransferase ArgJ n=1 Tax=Gilvimarinus sp. DZF01 TaxID=3461371 RepID=UPI0040463797
MTVGEIPLYEIPALAGVNLGTVGAAIKRVGRDDILVIELAEGSTAAGVFTQNAFCAAPVTLARQHLRACENCVRYLVINAGNANACTGEQGLRDARRICQQIADEKGVSVEQVLPFSTGVIGELLPVQKMLQALPQALAGLEGNNWIRAARSIMTTDTVPKAVSRQFAFEGETVTVTGIAKGSGMIKPNMATMLGFVATDAAVDAGVLDAVLRRATSKSFNRIVIDGDTSTNDACILMASGQAGVPAIAAAEGSLYESFADTVEQVFVELAQMMVRDGEGATKFIEINVAGGGTEEECRKVGYAIAQSPLVKTAFFASDPNWGRIVAAIGYAGVEGLDPARVSVRLGDVLIVDQGTRAQSYSEEQGQAVMNQSDIAINVDLGRGSAEQTLWTTDFSHEYVRINAEYRT